MQRHHLNKYLHPVNICFLGRSRIGGKMSREQQILSLLRQSHQSFTPKQIAEALDIPYNLVKTPLHRLIIKGFVKKTGRGKYVLKVTKSNIKSNMKVTSVIEEKVTKGDIESDKSNIESNKKVTGVIEEKVTKGSVESYKVTNERDKSDKKQFFPPDLVPLIKEYKDMTIRVSYAFYSSLWSLKLRMGKNLGELVEDAGIPHYNFHIPKKYLEEIRKKGSGI